MNDEQPAQPAPGIFAPFHNVPTNIDASLQSVRDAEGATRRMCRLTISAINGGQTAWMNEETVDLLIRHLSRISKTLKKLGPGLEIPSPGLEIPPN